MSSNIDEKQVDSVVDSLLSAVDAKTSSLSAVDKEIFLMKVRSKLQKKAPSAMGAPTICQDITECIGKTDLVKISNDFVVGCGNGEAKNAAEVVAKVEFSNPGLSVKDRIAIEMIEDAQAKGLIEPGKTTIVDITSGNTGVAYGMVGAAKGYKVIQIIPEPYSVERRALMLAMGVEVVVTKKEDGIPGAIKVYIEILKKLGDKGWAPAQFANPANLQAHYTKTGPEIWEQCGGKIDAIVAGYGTGGTVSGITQFLREKNPDFKCIVVEPLEQSHFNGDKPGPHGIQGIVPPFIPDNVKAELIDEVIRCSTADAMKTSRDLAKQQGIACGISAGANVWSACQVANRADMDGKRIVTILPSAAERYFSTPLYASLLEEAKNIPFATFDPSTEVTSEYINLNNLESIKAAGTQFRPGFHVS